MLHSLSRRKSPMNISCSCNHTEILWERLEYYIENNYITSQSDILGFTDCQSENFIIINHLLIFKSRTNKHLSFLQSKTNIIKVKTLEEDLSKGDNNKSKNWQKISDIFV